MSPFTTIGQLVAEDYRKAAVLRDYGIDFCCGGDITLAESCRQAGIDVQDVVDALNVIVLKENINAFEFNSLELDELVDHIIVNHHGYVKKFTPVISGFVNKLKKVHGDTRPEVIDIADRFNILSEELQAHMNKEEVILFPYIKQLVDAKRRGGWVSPPFGTIDNPIRIMRDEHDGVGHELKVIRELSNTYTPPTDACTTHQVSFMHLKDFEEDLLHHIQLENNILFPKAIVLEKELRSRS